MIFSYIFIAFCKLTFYPDVSLFVTTNLNKTTFTISSGLDQNLGQECGGFGGWTGMIV